MINKRDGLLTERAFVKGETDVSLSPIESKGPEKKHAGTSGSLANTVLWLRILNRTRITDSFEGHSRSRPRTSRVGDLKMVKKIEVCCKLEPKLQGSQYQ